MLSFIHLAFSGRPTGWEKSKLTFQAARVMSAGRHEETRAPKCRPKSGFEPNLPTFMRQSTAYELRLMAERYVRDDMTPEEAEREHLTTLRPRLAAQFNYTTLSTNPYDRVTDINAQLGVDTNDFQSNSDAAFGEVNWRPIDRVTLTGGLRYEGAQGADRGQGKATAS